MMKGMPAGMRSAAGVVVVMKSRYWWAAGPL
jgi:hypothetical protein